MNREYGLSEQFTEKHLHYAVKDSIIHSYMAVGKKGSMTGVEQEGFKIPEDEEETVCHFVNNIYMYLLDIFFMNLFISTS